MHHADDGVRRAIKNEPATENIAARIENVAPKIIANDRDGRGAFLTFFPGEGATLRRRQTENREEVRSDAGCGNSLRWRTVPEADHRHPACSRADAFRNVAAAFTEILDGAIAQTQPVP